MMGLAGLQSVCALSILAAVAMLPSPVGAETVAPVEGEGAPFDCAAATATAAGTEPFVAGLVDAIGWKWNLGVAEPDVLASAITVRACLTPEGRTGQVLLIASDGPSEEAGMRLFETARRAILRADADGGLPLPADGYDTWRVLDLVFDANGMRAR